MNSLPDINPTTRASLNQQLEQGLKFYSEGQVDVAELLLLHVLNIESNNPNALHLLGLIAYSRKNYLLAIEQIWKAIQSSPMESSFYFSMGNVLRDNHQLSEAAVAFEQAYKLNPSFTEAFYNCGLIHLSLNKIELAIICLKRAIELNANHAPAYANLAEAYKLIGPFEAIFENYEKALLCKPDYYEVLNNRGLLYHCLQKYDAAIKDFSRVTEINPQYAEAFWNKSMSLLMKGEFLQGWDLFEWRWKLPHNPQNLISSKPKWLGCESIMGKTLLIYSEQGFGDSIQFCRYAKLAADAGAIVLFQVEKQLVSILSRTPGVTHVFSKEDTLPPFDFQCPMMSLPLAFKTQIESIPFSDHYIYSDPEKVSSWGKILGEKKRFRVGLVWSSGFRGNQPELIDASERKNIPLAQLSPLKDLNIDFYSLQKGQPAESELLHITSTGWGNTPIHDYTHHIHDFSDTAAFIENLDLVISVCTSTPHLSAALGKPTWYMLRYDACWRWLIDRSDSPWYDEAKLYRQIESGNWNSVVAAIYHDLSLLIS